LLGLFGRRGASRAYRPDRFVSGDDTHQIIGCQTSQPPRQLRRHDLFFAPGVALFERLADTDDRREIEAQRRANLAIDHFVGLAVHQTALGMADDNARRARVFQHVAGDFTRVRALFRLSGNVLRGYFDVRALQSVSDGLDRGVRRRDDDLAMVSVRDQWLERGDRGYGVAD